VALIRQLKEIVDGIVTDLAKPEAQQSHWIRLRTLAGASPS
jgi:hypothetical protein